MCVRAQVTHNAHTSIFCYKRVFKTFSFDLEKTVVLFTNFNLETGTGWYSAKRR